MNRAWGRGRQRSQQGFSLIEALVVIFLISTVVLTFAVGLQASVTSDGKTNREQRLNLALTSFAEGLRRVTVPDSYWNCVNSYAEPTLEDAYMALYNSLSAADRAGTDAVDSAAVTGVSFWQPGDFSVPASTVPGTFGSTCVPGAGAVKLKIQVGLGDNVLVGEIVKRNPESPTP